MGKCPRIVKDRKFRRAYGRWGTFCYSGIGALAERLRKQVCFFDQRCHCRGHLFLCACISKGLSSMSIERTFY